MPQYLLSIYQPEGDPPGPEILEPIMRDLEAVRAEMKAAGVWVFDGALHAPSTATVLRVRGGDVLVTDGPMPRGRSTSAASRSSRPLTSMTRSGGVASSPRR